MPCRYGFAQRCGGTSLGYVVSFDGRDWRLGPPGTGNDGNGCANDPIARALQ